MSAVVMYENRDFRNVMKNISGQFAFLHFYYEETYFNILSYQISWTFYRFMIYFVAQLIA
jgi:hypothetical protein